MRLVGNISNANHADRFADYLLTLEITARVDAEGNAFAIWIRDEQSIDRARELFTEFQSAPDADRYIQAATDARTIRREEEQRQREIKKKSIDVRQQWAQPTLSRCRVTFFLMLTAVVVSVASNFGKNPDIFLRLALTGGLIDTLKTGQVWRLITPIFLHMGWMHLLFNLYWTYQFGILIESKKGSRGILLLVLFVAIVSNLGQFYASGPMFGGLSGVNYGLFGFLWIKSRFDRAAGWHVPESLVVFFLIWLVLCALGLFGPVANTAHFMGLLAGMAIPGVPLLLRR